MKFSRASAVLSASIFFNAAHAAPFSQPPDTANPPPYLNDLARAAGKLWFGTAADIPGTAEQFDTAYLNVLSDTNIFGEVTPANMMKFEFVQPEPSVFNFTGGDFILDLAEQTGKLVRCHNLIWVSELPDWVLNGNWTAETLTEVMRVHIQTTINYFGRRCYSWDVVNEALNGDGSFSSSIFFDTIGSEYFFLAYQFATEAVRQIGGGVKLYYNDFGIESPGTKTNATYALVRELQRRRIQIDGVGLESHFEVGGTPTTAQIEQAIQGYNELGVETAITELDVRFVQAPFYDAAGQAEQAQDYYQTVAACVGAGRGCIGITVWDFDDQYSWVPGTFPGQGGADLYNSTLQRKPAYTAVAQALQRQPCTVCS